MTKPSFITPMFLALPLLSTIAAEPRPTAIEQAVQIAAKGDPTAAIQHLSRHLQTVPADIQALDLRARLHDRERNHFAAIADFDRLLKLAADSKSKSSPNQATVAQWYNLRGASRFKNGDIAGSIGDFDDAIRRGPAIEQSHWQRGISYYYNGQYELGTRQFEQYQTYDAADVENVVWRFLCQAQAGGRTADAVAAARAEMLPLGARDRRVPMMKIDALYRGTGTVEGVFAAAKDGDPKPATLHQRMFYAHLYVGLYREATNNPSAAREHLLAADKLKIGHYMWDVAHVHAARTGAADSR